MSVSSTHPDYDKNIGRWVLVRDVVNSHVKTYIKNVDDSDLRRNERYKDDAQFTNFTARTKHGLVGAMFRKDLVVDLPTPILYLEKDSTGFGTTLTKLAQEVTGEVLQSGRYGLLVDYPASQDGLTVDEVANLNLSARIYRYKTESIINWQTRIENGIPVLSLVVLKEWSSDLGDDGFTWIAVCHYRVLRLVEGVYVQTLFNEDQEVINEYIPRQRDGSAWGFIPFVFVGSEDNDSDIDVAPLYDLSQLNIGHLRNSADYEESVHITGQPTLIISTDLSAEQFKDANPNGVKIGARRGHNLGSNGRGEFLQAAPNQLADVAMQRKEQQAVMIGARLITPTTINETATAALMRHTGETSVLALIAQNVEDALTKCLDYALLFMGDESQSEDIDITVNKEFFDKVLDPQMLMAQLQLFNNGIVAKEDLRVILRNHGAIPEDRTDEDIDADVDNDIGSDPGLDFLIPPRDDDGDE